MTKVMVAHPDVQHSHQLAVALQQAELLHSLVTQLYTSWEHPPFSLLRWLPPQYCHKIENNLFSKVRRSHPELNLERVSTFNAIPMLALVMMRRSGLISTGTWYRLTHPRFQRQVTNIAQHEEIKALVCSDGCAFEIFHHLANSEVKLVLDMSTPHPQTVKRIMAEEQELWPDLKEPLAPLSPTGARFEQVCQEAIVTDYIVAGSNFVRNSCVENGIARDKIFVLPYGTDIENFRPWAVSSTRQSFRILFVGRIGQLKGIRYLLDAYTQLNLPQAELWLCGRMIGTESLLQQYDVKYLGHIPHRQLQEIYNQVDVFVLPTLLEGFSQVCIEAMACGKPVITTPNSGLQGILRDGQDGFIVPIRDVEVLAKKLLYLYKNREACLDMGKSARQTVETYTWQRYREQAADVFARILCE